MNRTLHGWANYFQWGTVSKAYKAIDTYTTLRLRRWLRKKHRVRRNGLLVYPPEHLYGTLGLVCLPQLKRNVPWAKALGLVREPGAGDRHAGFDERGVETGLRSGY